MDTEFAALPAKGSLARTDQIVVATGGVPYRTTFPLPIIAGDGSTTVLAGSSTPFSVFRDVDVVTSGAAGLYLSLGARVGAALTEAVQLTGVLLDPNSSSLAINVRKAGVMTTAASLTTNGNLLVGRTNELNTDFRAHFDRAGASHNYVTVGNSANGLVLGVAPDGSSRIMTYAGASVFFGNYNSGGTAGTYGGFDANGNLLVGAVSGSNHIISRNVTTNAGNAVLSIYGAASGAAVTIYSVGSAGANAANAAMKVAQDSSTGRSINAGGTINASGSDYAEYLKKALEHLTVVFLKGQVLGVNDGGQLTCKWSEAHSFVIKSYDPSIVGGDSWASYLERPIEPVLELPAYEGPEEPQEPDPLYSLRLVAWHEAQAAHAAAIAAAEAAHADAIAIYAQDLAAFELALEEARATVDRVAFSGQVPVIVEGPYSPGQYLVAEEGADDTILCRAWGKADLIADRMAGGDMDFRTVGKVWAVRSVQLDPADRSKDPEMVSRAWAIVLHS